VRELLKATAAVILAALTFACGDEEGFTPPPAHTPADVIKSVEISFNQRDIEKLKNSLSRDFVFYFDPDDVGRRPPGKPSYEIPEWWSYTEFWQAVRNMFEKAYTIKLTIPTSQIGTPDPGETTYKAENVSISLLVMVDENNGYLADQGYCNFAFESYVNDKKEKRWHLIGWWDYTSGAADFCGAAEASSLGKILALYK
jgi:hypothetical protein